MDTHRLISVIKRWLLLVVFLLSLTVLSSLSVYSVNQFGDDTPVKNTVSSVNF